MGSFERTEDRKDFALDPPQKSMLDKLQEHGLDTISVGKVYDVFNGKGISKKIVAKNNQAGLKAISNLIDADFKGLMFANLVDTDMLYGHRNNVQGYSDALKQIDDCLQNFLPRLRENDIFMLTADHGCDPTTPSTDHSREYVPLLIYGKNLKSGVNFGTIEGFNIISKSILDLFNIEKCESSLFRKLVK